ncbi:MAG TPA: 4-hydroxy-tetrahydrodipicolinate reductase [Bacteroidales bacterium]|nr:MAG: 4-hydroxy-tetrahydrodipicolinate reductase [Bacteroidetes bacterium GWF2_33_38]OFY89967.1 MAG: 4-hydroxy-tetrahydrodipicolinate reductase [Bacteroidetes bacterium RIFOXYA2_FULL_33_7]HBF89082.1 4-hydroxy-tetrahydrodipicolinate reductase [Bacteroidales bacterium]
MKIAIIGYGKMGHAIEKIAKERNHEIAIIIDKNDDITLIKNHKIDVAIEFSTPETAYQNIKTCLNSNVPIVVGTTGWLDKYTEIENLCNEKKSSFIFASNYSIGANIYFEINRKLAKIMNNQSNFEISIEETHHIHKLDAPSGTAIVIANDIIKEIDRKTSWSLEKNEENSIHINAIRKGEIFGNHTVDYESENDIIEITHKAKSRNGLAFGAVVAAEYIHNKKGIFTMKDILNF